ncbi:MULTISPECIES: hypothetical protein [unclassified Mesorhizobium]|uniref:hypothetical protein n=1 Tax=unclassified Mesorhizobium TaxID=325217 RepID=UPI001FE21A4B|nr:MULTISPECIES: hypothetical protein [unclassified Mesorhizobium]MDG4887640.1 hypothetical protein [Mesorhizobium sp. WSM4887]MCT2580542.1 hypothetical protein [Mesorhizobium sp. P13.3]MDF3169484.1 hypothetical protein [Mesorhizobium sp. P16.1]MDF3178854.1 hypothetical protein [Mesorhizobium sp. P17.1]MDF3186399.1 hypothetical protein [Mesorhizobium sp. ICCV3110.1]
MEHFARPPIEVVAYTAGFIDGEGTISVKGNRFRVVVSQSVTNDGATICRWLRDAWCVGTVAPSHRVFHGKTWEQWFWTVAAAREVKHVIDCCLPYFHVKRSAADQVGVRVNDFLNNGHRCRWSPEEIKFLGDQWRRHDDWIGEQLRRSATSVRHQRRALGLAKPPGGL